MNNIRANYILLLLCTLSLVACRKGAPLPQTEIVSIGISKLFDDSPALDVYINGKLVIQLAKGATGLPATTLLDKGSSLVKVSIAKKGETAVLKDTILKVVNDNIVLTYMYSEALGFNRFVGDDFKRPAADSLAVQLYNKFDYGSHQQTIYLYKSPDGSAYDPVHPIDSIKGLAYNALSEVIQLPGFEKDGTPIIYTAVAQDAVTGYNGTADYLLNIGLDPPLYGGFPLNTPLGVGVENGKLTIVRLTNMPYDENGVHYEQVYLDILFAY